MTPTQTFDMKTNHSLLCPVAAILLADLLSPSLPASDLLRDHFAYPDGPLVGATGSPWAAHSAAGSGPVLVQAGRIWISANQAEDINAPLQGAPYEPAGLTNVLYARFKVSFAALPGAAGSYFAHFRSGATLRARLWASQANAAPGFYRLGIGNSTGADANSGQVPQDLSLDRVYEVVIRYNLASGLSSIGLDPAGESGLTVTATDPVGLTGIGTFGFRQAGGVGDLWVDDLVVSDRFPEPDSPQAHLSIASSAGGIRVSWPAVFTNLVLQQTDSLTVRDWSDVSSPPESSGQERFMRFPKGGGSYYRLIQRP